MKRILFLFLFLCSLFFCFPAQAAEPVEKVDVTVTTDVSIVFDADASVSVSQFYVNNRSLVPITMRTVSVTAYNGWGLVPAGSTILADTKQLALGLENYYLQTGSNSLSIMVPEQTKKELLIMVERGAWTTSFAEQTAFHMEFSYDVGQKEFELTFDANGGDSQVAAVSANNEDTVILPKATRKGYDFAGWQDEEGKLYKDIYTMPIGDVTLTATWKLKIAYAVFSADDGSFTFYNTSDTITAGSKYKNKTVTAVFTGFLHKQYTEKSLPPWDSYKLQVKRVIVADEISPTYTACWFLRFRNCNYMELSKLDMSGVIDMSYMINLVASASTATALEIHGLADWNVSNVTNMYAVFNGTGKYATSFYIDDLSRWDVSKVTTMHSFFNGTGRYVAWSMDLSGWDVRNVTDHLTFDAGNEGKIIHPNWVN